MHANVTLYGSGTIGATVTVSIDSPHKSVQRAPTVARSGSAVSRCSPVARIRVARPSRCPSGSGRGWVSLVNGGGSPGLFRGTSVDVPPSHFFAPCCIFVLGMYLCYCPSLLRLTFLSLRLCLNLSLCLFGPLQRLFLLKPSVFSLYLSLRHFPSRLSVFVCSSFFCLASLGLFLLFTSFFSPSHFICCLFVMPFPFHRYPTRSPVSSFLR